jgi:hypothetical protein
LSIQKASVNGCLRLPITLLEVATGPISKELEVKRIELRNVLPQGVSNSQLRKALTELGLPTDESFDFSAVQVQKIQDYFAKAKQSGPSAAITQSEQNPQSVEDAGSQLARAVSTQNEIVRQAVVNSSNVGDVAAIQVGTAFLSSFSHTSALVWGEIGNVIEQVNEAVLDPTLIETQGKSPEEVARFFGNALRKGFQSVDMGQATASTLPDAPAPAKPEVKLAEFPAQKNGQTGSAALEKQAS